LSRQRAAPLEVVGRGRLGHGVDGAVERGERAPLEERGGGIGARESASVWARWQGAQSAGDAAWVGKEMRRRMGRPHVI
jgi:hypothetical protein